MELGFGVTASREECKVNLIKLGVPERVTARAVAKVLAMMVRTHSSGSEQVALQNLRSTSSLWNDKEKMDGGMSQSWNVDNFVLALSEIVSPTLRHVAVILQNFLKRSELDCPEISAVNVVLNEFFLILSLFRPRTSTGRK